MPPEPSRRTTLYGLAASAAAVVAFDPMARAWATEAPEGKLPEVPPLDGTLLTDAASRDAAAEDYGHHVHRRPAAVLRPGSVDDVVTMVRFCRRHRIPVAARGQGHATMGQGQTEGLVIATSPLDGIGPVEGDTVTVGAGAKWSDVARATLRHGLTPPVFTDYLELSVGGTLSVGGLGGQTHQHGAQTDTVTELTVVTGAGELVRCSATRHGDLFDAVRAGLGQCGIIVGATLRLVPAPDIVRHYELPYTDLGVFLADQQLLTEQRRFAYVEGLVAPDDTGAYRNHVLEAVSYDSAPDDEQLLAGLHHDRSGMKAENLPYYDFLDRLAESVRQQKEAGVWDDPHPWLNLLLPGAATEQLAAGILQELTPADLGGGVVLLYPLHGEHLRTPMLRMPDDPVPYLLAVLRTAPPDDPAAVERLLTANRRAYEAVREAGGTQYPVGSVPFEQADWRDHFGAAWPRLAEARDRYDPTGILTPGQGIF